MITVVGMDGSPLSARAEKALAAATLVAGARRHLTAAGVPAPALATGGGPPVAGRLQRAGVIVLGDLAPALDALAGHEGDAVVLASGDPGFFGIVRALRERGLQITVLPAVSSVATAFARAGLPWDDAVVVSAHGRDPRPAVNVCRAHPKVAVLTGPGTGPAEIGAALAGWDRRLIVAEHLGSDAERVTGCSPAEAAGRAWEDPNVILVLAPARTRGKAMNAAFITKDVRERHIHREPHRAGPGEHVTAGAGLPEGAGGLAIPGAPAGGGAAARATARAAARAGKRAGKRAGTAGAGWLAGGPGAPGGWALSEEEFDSRDAVLTKAEVRALALARLGPGPGMLVWDVGAGSGSVAVECARFGAAVIAVERDPVRCERVRANAARHGVDVRVVPGEAPGALAELPDPDAVFVGGGGPAVIEAAAARRPARIVVALAAMERAGPAAATLAAAGYATGGALIQASRFAPLPGEVHRLAATNPVFLVWAAVSQEPASAAHTTSAAGAGPNAAKAPRGRRGVPAPRTSLPKPGRPPGPTAREGGRCGGAPG